MNSFRYPYILFVSLISDSVSNIAAKRIICINIGHLNAFPIVKSFLTSMYIISSAG